MRVLKPKAIQGIYIIENNINGKCYIGQSKDIIDRFRSHTIFSNLKKPYPLYRAFKKYGLIEFSFFVLEEVEDEYNLTSREQYWYDKLKPEYKSNRPINNENS